MPADWSDIHAGARRGPLQNLANRVAMKAAAGDITEPVDSAEDGTVGDLSRIKPRPECTDRTSFRMIG
jgi:hypothetical protein